MKNLNRRYAYRGQSVTVTVRATGEVVTGFLDGFGVYKVRVIDTERKWREFAVGSVTVQTSN